MKHSVTTSISKCNFNCYLHIYIYIYVYIYIQTSEHKKPNLYKLYKLSKPDVFRLDLKHDKDRADYEVRRQKTRNERSLSAVSLCGSRLRRDVVGELVLCMNDSLCAAYL